MSSRTEPIQSARTLFTPHHLTNEYQPLRARDTIGFDESKYYDPSQTSGFKRFVVRRVTGNDTYDLSGAGRLLMNVELLAETYGTSGVWCREVKGFGRLHLPR
mgnify:CR=1 FL=1